MANTVNAITVRIANETKEYLFKETSFNHQLFIKTLILHQLFKLSQFLKFISEGREYLGLLESFKHFIDTLIFGLGTQNNLLYIRQHGKSLKKALNKVLIHP